MMGLARERRQFQNNENGFGLEFRPLDFVYRSIGRRAKRRARCAGLETGRQEQEEPAIGATALLGDLQRGLRARL